MLPGKTLWLSINDKSVVGEMSGAWRLKYPKRITACTGMAELLLNQDGTMLFYIKVYIFVRFSELIHHVILAIL